MVTLMKELDKDGNGMVEFPEFLHGMDFLNNLSAQTG
jgi:Ca2+-binding EF-hand superfamily protein